MIPQKYFERLTPLYCKLCGREWHLATGPTRRKLPEAAAGLTRLMASAKGVEPWLRF
jgi:hypothetical protein